MRDGGLKSTTSPSGQFIAVGGNRDLRLEANRVAGEIQTLWNQVLGLQEKWVSPILLFFPEDQRKKPREPFILSALAGDGDSLRFQLEIWQPDLLGSQEFAAAVISAITVEYISRTQPPAIGRPLRLPPLWFVNALVEAYLAKTNPSPVQLIEGLISTKRPPSVSGVFRQRSLPGSLAEQTSFRILSFALLRTLLEEPGGKENLQAAIRENGNTMLSQESILKNFPSLANEPDSLERKWVLTLARMTLPSRTSSLSMAETSRELLRLMDLSATPPESEGRKDLVRGPAAAPLLAREEGGSRMLMTLASELMRLELRSHPLYIPIAKEYREILIHLSRKPKSNVRKRIEKNDALFLALRQRSTEIEDHMNWFELNQVGSPDREFREILRIQEESFLPDPRGDAISNALDAHQSWTR